LATKKAKLSSTFSVSKKTHTLERLVLLKDVKLTTYEDTTQVRNVWRLDAGAVGLVLQCDSAGSRSLWIKFILDAKNSLLGRRKLATTSKNGPKDKQSKAAQTLAKESEEEEVVVAHELTRRFTKLYLDKSIVDHMQDRLWELENAIALGHYERAEDMLERLQAELANLPNSTDAVKLQGIFGDLRMQFRDRLLRMFALEASPVDRLAQARVILQGSLGAVEDAQDVFLKTRAMQLRSLLQRLQMGSDVFLRDYVYVTGSILRETAQAYYRIFEPNSAYLFWLRLQLKELSGAVARLLLTYDPNVSDDKKAHFETVRCDLQSCYETLAVSTEGIGIDCLLEFEYSMEPLLETFLQTLCSSFMRELRLTLDDKKLEAFDEFETALEIFHLLQAD
jgi:hypothetical protein